MRWRTILFTAAGPWCRDGPSSRSRRNWRRWTSRIVISWVKNAGHKPRVHCFDISRMRRSFALSGVYASLRLEIMARSLLEEASLHLDAEKCQELLSGLAPPGVPIDNPSTGQHRHHYRRRRHPLHHHPRKQLHVNHQTFKSTRISLRPPTRLGAQTFVGSSRTGVLLELECR